MVDISAFIDELEARKEQAVDIFDAMGDALFSVDNESRVTFANKELGRLLDRDVNSLIGKNIAELIPESGGWMFFRYLEKARLEKKFVKLDYFIFADKRFEVYFYPARDGLAVFLHDITVKWHTEELYRLALFLLDRLNEAVFLVRFDGRLFHVNDETCQLLGYSRHELIHMKIYDIDSHITEDGWEDEFNSIKEQKQAVFESILKAKDGTLIPAEVYANFVKLYGNEYYCVTARDITERKLAEEKISHLASFPSFNPNPIVEIDIDGNLLYMNPAARTIFPDMNEKGAGHPLLAGLNTIVDELEAKNKSYIIRDVNVDGSYFQETIHRVTNKNALRIYVLDVTERKQAEDSLRTSEANLANAQRISHLGNWVWDTKRDEVRCSKEFYSIFGIDVQEFITYEQFINMLNPLDREPVNKVVDAALYRGVPYRTDYRVIWPDDSEHIIHAEGEVSLDGAGKPILMFGTVQDITERKIAEMELQKAKALVEMYNDLLGHDINNMNQVGIGYLELALNTPGLNEDFKKLLQKPLEALHNSSNLIANVKKLQRIRYGEVRHKKMDINIVLLDVKKSYSSVQDRDIIIKYSSMPGCMVMANELLTDVFSNLVGNAIKHSTGGTLVVGIGMSRVSENGKEYYRVFVEDNGPGIPDNVKNKLFTRFQRGNTKASGKGLGLYLVKTLVEDYCGSILVEDRVPGDHAKGSKFVVMLPAVE